MRLFFYKKSVKPTPTAKSLPPFPSQGSKMGGEIPLMVTSIPLVLKTPTGKN